METLEDIQARFNRLAENDTLEHIQARFNELAATTFNTLAAANAAVSSEIEARARVNAEKAGMCGVTFTNINYDT